ncbi:AsmA family protein [Teichococcus aestuarii]|uniref:AsmA family protein n=1 Tax=Teichococcus aestuarii TaxID=568898 RepID=UPI00360E9DCF
MAPPRRRRRRTLLAGAAVLVAVPVLAWGGLNLVLRDSVLRPRVIAAVEQATGRALTLSGPVGIKLSLVPTVTLEGVALANAPGGSRAEMLTASRVEARLALLPLLSRRIAFERLTLIEPDLLLEVDAEGQGNWRLSPPPRPPRAGRKRHPAARPRGGWRSPSPRWTSRAGASPARCPHRAAGGAGHPQPRPARRDPGGADRLPGRAWPARRGRGAGGACRAAGAAARHQRRARRPAAACCAGGTGAAAGGRWQRDAPRGRRRLAAGPEGHGREYRAPCSFLPRAGLPRCAGWSWTPSWPMPAPAARRAWTGWWRIPRAAISAPGCQGWRWAPPRCGCPARSSRGSSTPTSPCAACRCRPRGSSPPRPRCSATGPGRCA